VPAKRYYTFMIDPGLIAALKKSKAKTGMSEGAQIRDAIRSWLEGQGIAVRGQTPREGESRVRRLIQKLQKGVTGMSDVPYFSMNQGNPGAYPCALVDQRLVDALLVWNEVMGTHLKKVSPETVSTIDPPWFTFVTAMGDYGNEPTMVEGDPFGVYRRDGTPVIWVWVQLINGIDGIDPLPWTGTSEGGKCTRRKMGVTGHRFGWSMPMCHS
jgi:hypothetical protein